MQVGIALVITSPPAGWQAIWDNLYTFNRSVNKGFPLLTLITKHLKSLLCLKKSL